jgi:UPF0716 protein FxsA
MTLALLIVLIAVPLLEIAVMIKVGQWIGFWPSLGIVVGTFMLGASVLASSGLSSAIRVQDALLKGAPPVPAMLDGALLAFAGILLATPGFIADTIGLLLLLPPLRSLTAGWLATRAFVQPEVHMSRGTFRTSGQEKPFENDQQPFGDGDGKGSGPVIDGEFERLDERPMDKGRRPRGRPD